MDAIPASVWAVIGSSIFAIVSGIVGVLWGKNSHRRDSALTSVTEAQAKAEISEINKAQTEYAGLQRRFDVLEVKYEVALGKIKELEDADSKRIRDEANAAVAEMKKERDRSVELLPPHLRAQAFMPSEFGDQVMLRPIPPRPAPAPPQDPFQAAQPYELPPTVYGRRATDKLHLQFPSPDPTWTDKDAP